MFVRTPAAVWASFVGQSVYSLSKHRLRLFFFFEQRQRPHHGIRSLPCHR